MIRKTLFFLFALFATFHGGYSGKTDDPKTKTKPKPKDDDRHDDGNGGFVPSVAPTVAPTVSSSTTLSPTMGLSGTFTVAPTADATIVSGSLFFSSSFSSASSYATPLNILLASFAAALVIVYVVQRSYADSPKREFNELATSSEHAPTRETEIPTLEPEISPSSKHKYNIDLKI